MDVILLSRLQFAVATIFHFLFVPLTLGLSILIAVMETRYVRTGDEEYRHMARFWGKLFLINFALGLVTGITLEFQFGTNWSRFSAYVGDVFGSLLAIEATAAFFLESTFIAVWAFGWKRLSPKAHAAVMWLLAVASNLSAFWILAANAWMQHPVGYVVEGHKARLSDFWALISGSFFINEFIHVLLASYIVTAFFVMGISAYHLLKKNQPSFFKKSLTIALILALAVSVGEVVQGHWHGHEVAVVQPAKLAAMEPIWETTSAAPFYLILVPDQENERNIVEFGKIPYALSMLAFHRPNAEVKGLLEFPADERPPVLITYIAFRLMVGLGMLFALISAVAFLKRKTIEKSPLILKVLLVSLPLPYLAAELGWIVAEMGRQPWVVYGLMKTGNAASPVSSAQVLVSLIFFVLVYSFLAGVAVYLMAKTAKAGPEKSGAKT